MFFDYEQTISHRNLQNNSLPRNVIAIFIIKLSRRTTIWKVKLIILCVTNIDYI